MDELTDEFKDRVVVGKVNVDTDSKLSTFFNIKNIPNLTFIKINYVFEHMSGLVPKPISEEMLEDLGNIPLKERSRVEKGIECEFIKRLLLKKKRTLVSKIRFFNWFISQIYRTST